MKAENFLLLFSKLRVVKYCVKTLAHVSFTKGFTSTDCCCSMLCLMSTESCCKYSIVMSLKRSKLMENLRGKVCDVNMSRRVFCTSDQSQKANANWA